DDSCCPSLAPKPSYASNAARPSPDESSRSFVPYAVALATAILMGLLPKTSALVTLAASAGADLPAGAEFGDGGSVADGADDDVVRAARRAAHLRVADDDRAVCVQRCLKGDGGRAAPAVVRQPLPSEGADSVAVEIADASAVGGIKIIPIRGDAAEGADG